MRDIATLTFPAKAKYILPLRLYISGLATRMEFEVNALEDIKTAVSEACVLLLGGIADGELAAEIGVGEDTLEVILRLAYFEKKAEAEEDVFANQDLSRIILESMADECQIGGQEGINTEINMKFKK